MSDGMMAKGLPDLQRLCQRTDIPSTDELTQLYTNELSAERALEVLAIIESDEAYMTLFREVTALMLESHEGSAEDVLKGMRQLNMARQDGVAACEALAADKQTLPIIREYARGEVAKVTKEVVPDLTNEVF